MSKKILILLLVIVTISIVTFSFVSANSFHHQDSKTVKKIGISNKNTKYYCSQCNIKHNKTPKEYHRYINCGTCNKKIDTWKQKSHNHNNKHYPNHKNNHPNKHH